MHQPNRQADNHSHPFDRPIRFASRQRGELPPSRWAIAIDPDRPARPFARGVRHPHRRRSMALLLRTGLLV